MLGGWNHSPDTGLLPGGCIQAELLESPSPSGLHLRATISRSMELHISCWIGDGDAEPRLWQWFCPDFTWRALLRRPVSLIASSSMDERMEYSSWEKVLPQTNLLLGAGYFRWYRITQMLGSRTWLGPLLEGCKKDIIMPGIPAIMCGSCVTCCIILLEKKAKGSFGCGVKWKWRRPIAFLPFTTTKSKVSQTWSPQI